MIKLNRIRHLTAKTSVQAQCRVVWGRITSRVSECGRSPTERWRERDDRMLVAEARRSDTARRKSVLTASASNCSHATYLLHHGHSCMIYVNFEIYRIKMPKILKVFVFFIYNTQIDFYYRFLETGHNAQNARD